MNFIFEIKEGLKIAFSAVLSNKLRSSLTMLGIIIGIISVTMMGTVIEGINRSFKESVSVFGANVLYIQKFPWVSEEDFSKFRNRRNLEIRFSDYILKHSTTVESTSPNVSSIANISFLSNQFSGAFISGTSSLYQKTTGGEIQDGRYFSESEDLGGRQVCVIGANVKEELFGSIDPIGKIIKVNGSPYKILGVYEKQGGMFGSFTTDNRVYVPIKSFVSKFGSGRRDVTINVLVKDDVDIEEAKEEIRGIMRQLRRLSPIQEDDFNINQQGLLSNILGQLTIIISVIGFFITGLSLFVGGIGIMNIMFVSVAERTKEIGIRKSIGAKRRTILFQFLVEASIISLLGGLVGVMVSYPLSLIVNNFLPTSMPIFIIGVSLLISISVGIISGFLPALKASKMDPVEALRYE